jgi:hypothetical protein
MEKFRAGLGQVVLLEWPERADAKPVTGVVQAGGMGVVTVDLTSDPGDEFDGSRALVSVFAPEAMYRARATLRFIGGRLARLSDLEADEPIQRRRWPRRRVALAVSLVPIDDAVPVGVRGETVDVSVGGARVVTHDPLPAGQDPLVAITMPEGDVLLVPGLVIHAEHDRDHFAYGVVFPEIGGDEAARLAALVSNSHN